MSRISLDRRIERLRDYYLQPGSLEHRAYHLPENLRDSYQSWRKERVAIISRAEKQPGDAYAALINGKLNLPPTPRAVQLALFPNNGKIYDNVYEAYQAMLEG